MATNPPREQLELLNSELQARAEMQSSEMEGLDRKATTMLAGTGVVLALLINNVDKFAATAGVAVEPHFVFFLALVLLAAALVAGVAVLWPREVKVIPDPRRLVEGYYGKGTDDTLASLISTRLTAAELNKNLSVGKLRALKAQMLLVALGGISLVLAYVWKEWK